MSQLTEDEKNFVSCFCKAFAVIREHNYKFDHVHNVKIRKVLLKPPVE